MARVGVLGAERLLVDRDGALVERLGLRVAAGVPVEQGQVVERGGEVWVLGAERLLADRDSALVERLGLRVAAGVLVEIGQVVEPGGEGGVLGAERFSPIAMARWKSGSACA